MIRLLEISDTVFSILNVTELKSLISGRIYNGKLPFSEDYESGNIEILTNLPEQQGTDINTGIININIYTPDESSGMADKETLKPIMNKVVELIEAWQQANTYITFSMQGASLLQDSDMKGVSYINLRVSYSVEN